jgi:hypothetical protein
VLGQKLATTTIAISRYEYSLRSASSRPGSTCRLLARFVTVSKWINALNSWRLRNVE